MQMQHLRIGDRVQIVRKDGSLGFEDIYFFGHNDAKAIANFIRLTVQARLVMPWLRRLIDKSFGKSLINQWNTEWLIEIDPRWVVYSVDYRVMLPFPRCLAYVPNLMLSLKQCLHIPLTCLDDKVHQAIYWCLTLQTLIPVYLHRKGEIGMRQHLDISHRHFLHARSQSSAKYELVRAKDVAVGDFVQIRGLTGLQEGEVVGISEVRKEGLWNPYTTGGSIVVNGVAASVHSEWILDSVLDVLGLTQYLPALYQVSHAPPLNPVSQNFGLNSLMMYCNSSFAIDKDN